MLRLSLLLLLVLTSGVLCDRERGPRGKDGGKREMPPIQVSCNNNLVNSWVSSIFADSTTWFDEKTKEKLQGRDYFTDYSQLLTGLQNNICLMRELAQRADQPSYCSQYTKEQLMDCPDMEEMGKMKMMKGMKKMKCDKDVRKSICQLFQDRKSMQKIEEWIVKDYTMWTDCSDLNENTLRFEFNQFWRDPQNWMRNQINAAPTLEKVKMFKDCFPHYAAKNLRQTGQCSSVTTPAERATMERKPSIDDQQSQIDQIWTAKKNLLDQATGRKYLCLVYYKVTADRSTQLGVDMDMGGYFWFKGAFKNITKDIKSQIVWTQAANPTQAARDKAGYIRDGAFSRLTMPAWKEQGRAPTFQEWKQFMEEGMAVVYNLYNSADVRASQYSALVSEIQGILQNMYSNRPGRYGFGNGYGGTPPVNYKGMLKDVWERNSDNPQAVPVMMRAKIDKLMELKNENNQYKKYDIFEEMLEKYIKKRMMENMMTNPNCNTINNLIQYRTVAGYIVNRNWAQLETQKQNWPQDLNKMQSKTIKACIINEVYNQLGSSCSRYSQRQTQIRNFVTSLESDSSLDKQQKKKFIKSKLMQRRNKSDGMATLCDLYFMVSASSMDETKKKMHFGEKLWEVKGKLMEYDSLINLNTGTCSDAAKFAVFNKMSMAIKGDMRRDMDDDYEDDEGDEDEDYDDDEDDDDYDYDEDEDDDDDYEDDDDDYEDDDDDYEDDDDNDYGDIRGGRMKDKMKGKGKYGKKGEKMKMCKSMRDFKTCTDKLTCALVNEKLRSINCNQASRYSEMVRNIDNNWAAIQQKIDSNTNFDFFDDLIQLSREIKNYGKAFAPCVMKKITEVLRQYWGMDECPVMLFVMKMKMKSRWDDDRSGPGRRPPVPPGRPPMPGQFPPNMGQGQGTPQRPPFRQAEGGRFSFNNWGRHPQGGQWNRQA